MAYTYISCATYTNLIILTRTDKVEQSQAGEEEGEVCRGGHHQPFIPLVVKTTGVVGLKVQTFFEELGHQLRGTTGEPQARQYLLQRISVASVGCVLKANPYRLTT